MPCRQEYSTVQTCPLPPLHPQSIVQTSPHLDGRLIKAGRVFHNWAIKVSLINIDVKIEGLQGQSVKEIYWDFKLVRLNSLDISLSVRLILWNLSEIPLRKERG